MDKCATGDADLPTAPYRVLILADDPATGSALAARLGHYGFDATAQPVEGVSTPTQAGRPPIEPAVEAVIVLASRQGWDYVAFCGRLHQALDPRVPLCVMAESAGVIDRVLALEVGADDILPRAVSPRELAARLRARLRRGRLECVAAASSDPALPDSRLRVGGLCIDLEQRQVWLDDRRVDLRRREFDLLALLAQNRGRTLTRGRLARLWDEPPAHGSRTLDMHIRRLREKIEPDPTRPQYIHTERGVGYRLDWEPARSGACASGAPVAAARAGRALSAADAAPGTR